MQYEIVEVPIGFSLFGLSSPVANRSYGPTGLALMNRMWDSVRDFGLATTGINHWVYLPGDKIFVGVELRASNDLTLPMGLQPLTFELRRYLKHLHVGPYQTLPQKWAELMAFLKTAGERPSMPSLEVYGHICEDADTINAETTILIGLGARPAA